MATEHFTDEELRCHCGCGGLPPQGFQNQLEEFRQVWGQPMRISSGYRCPDHNARVSSTGRNGPHTLGAVDVLVWGEEAFELVAEAIAWGWMGIGVSQKGPYASRFIHLDDLEDVADGGQHPRPRIWSY